MDHFNWTENLSRYDKNNLVFIDENGINTDLTRIYGRAAGWERCNDKVPLNTPQNTTILSSIDIMVKLCIWFTRERQRVINL